MSVSRLLIIGWSWMLECTVEPCTRMSEAPVDRSDGVVARLLEPVGRLAAILGLQGPGATSLVTAAGAIIAAECNRLRSVYGSLAGPAEVERGLGDSPGALVGWLSPALGDAGVSYGCAFTDGDTALHIVAAEAHPALLFSCVALPTFSLVAHDGAATLVIEAQAPVCVLSFSELFMLASSMVPVAASVSALPTRRVHASGTVVSVGAPFVVKRGGSRAMLVIFQLDVICRACAQSGECSCGGAAAAAADGSRAFTCGCALPASASLKDTVTVTLLVKGDDLVPQWRDLVQPGCELLLIGLEKQRIRAGEGTDTLTVLRVRQHPLAVLRGWLSRPQHSGSVLMGGQGLSSAQLGTVAILPVPCRPAAALPSTWLGEGIGRAARETGSHFGSFARRHEGSCITYSGVVTLVTPNTIVFDDDARTTVWGLPGVRLHLPALRVGCSATVHNAHALLVGCRLVGLGWCAATSVSVNDFRGGWLRLSECDWHGRRALTSSAAAVHSSDDNAAMRLAALSNPASTSAVVWLLACRRRLAMAGLVPGRRTTSFCMLHYGVGAGDNTRVGAWSLLVSALRPLGALPDAPVPPESLPAASVYCNLGPSSRELVLRVCERSMPWNGESMLPRVGTDDTLDVDVETPTEVLPSPCCPLSRGFPASRAIVLYTPSVLAALGQCTSGVLAGMLRRHADHTHRNYKDGMAVQTAARTWSATLRDALLASEPLSAIFNDSVCPVTASEVQVMSGGDWTRVTIRLPVGRPSCPAPVFVGSACDQAPVPATGPAGSRLIHVRDARVTMPALTCDMPQLSNIRLPTSATETAGDCATAQVRFVTCTNFSVLVDVVRVPDLFSGCETRAFTTQPDALSDFLRGSSSPVDLLMRPDAESATEATIDSDAGGAARPGPQGLVATHSWRDCLVSQRARKRRRRSASKRRAESLELSATAEQIVPSRLQFVSRIFLAFPCRDLQHRAAEAASTVDGVTRIPLVCSVRASLTGLGDALAVLMKKALVRPVLVGTVQRIAALSTAQQRGGLGIGDAAEAPPAAEKTAATLGCMLKLTLRHVPVVATAAAGTLGSESLSATSSFGPETVDVYFPCAFADTGPLLSLPLGFGPGALVALEHLRPVVAPKTRNLYWVSHNETPPSVSVLAIASDAMAALESDIILAHLAPSSPAATASAAVSPRPRQKRPPVLLLDSLLWPLGGTKSSAIGSAFPLRRSCRSLAIDPVFDRTHFVVRGQPRQVLWACAQWEDGVSGGLLEPSRSSLHVPSAAALQSRKLGLANGAEPGAIGCVNVLGVSMTHRPGQTGPAAHETTSASTHPVFKFEAKVAIDDGTGEAILQLHDSYELADLELLAAALESRAQGVAWSRHHPTRLGVAASTVGVSLFWLGHWAAVAALFGPLQVMSRLSAAAAGALVVDNAPTSSNRSSEDAAKAAFATLLAVESAVPTGFFQHLEHITVDDRPQVAPATTCLPSDYSKLSAELRPGSRVGVPPTAGSKRKARRSSGAAQRAPAPSPSATLAARYTSRLPYKSLELASASLHTHLARALCATVTTREAAVCRPSISGAQASSLSAGSLMLQSSPVFSLDFVCVRTFPLPFHPGAGAGSADAAPREAGGELERRALATRQAAEAPLRRLLGLTVSAPPLKGAGGIPSEAKAPPQNRELPMMAGLGSSSAAPRVTLRCIDVRPVAVQSSLASAARRCRELFAGLQPSGGLTGKS